MTTMEQLPASAPATWGGAKEGAHQQRGEPLPHTTAPSSPCSRCLTALSCGHLSIKDQAQALGRARLLSTSVFVIVFCDTNRGAQPTGQQILPDWDGRKARAVLWG